MQNLESCSLGAVLVIVETENLRRSLTFLLKKSGIQVDSARHAEEGIYKLQSGRFKLALIDINLNSRFSRDLLSQISNNHPELSIIILVPSLPKGQRISGYQKVEYIQKPIAPARLLERMRIVMYKNKTE